MLLRSRALEISVEGCIWTPAPPGGEVLLADVLRAFLDPGLAPSVPSLLASKVTELSGVLMHESQAARSAAAAALAALVAALKAPHERQAAGVSKPYSSKQLAPAETTAALAAVDSELAAQQAALARAATARDRALVAKRVLALSDRRLELLAGTDGGALAGGTNAVAVQAAIRDLGAWTSLVGVTAKVRRSCGPPETRTAYHTARFCRPAAHDVVSLSAQYVKCCRLLPSLKLFVYGAYVLIDLKHVLQLLNILILILRWLHASTCRVQSRRSDTGRLGRGKQTRRPGRPSARTRGWRRRRHRSSSTSSAWRPSYGPCTPAPRCWRRNAGRWPLPRRCVRALLVCSAARNITHVMQSSRDRRLCKGRVLRRARVIRQAHMECPAEELRVASHTAACAAQNGRRLGSKTPSAGASDRQLELAAALQQILISAAGSVTSSGGGSAEARGACEAYVDAVQRLLESNNAYVSEVCAAQMSSRRAPTSTKRTLCRDSVYGV